MNKQQEQKNKELKRVLYTGVIILGILAILFASIARDAALKVEYYEEITILQCETMNIETELLQEIFPDAMEYKCSQFKEALNNSVAAEILCQELRDIEMPEEIDCYDLLI